MSQHEPVRVYQTNSSRLYLPSILVYAEWSEVFGVYLYPAGTRTKEPPALQEYESARSLGDDLNSDWEVIPNYVGFTYWAADGARHTITSIGEAPPEGFLTSQPPPTAQQMQAQIGAAVTAKLDNLASSWRYSGYISARSYIGDSYAKYSAEAQVLADYGSACFQVLDALEAAVLAGTTTMPATVEEVLAMLPAEPSRPVVGG